MTSAIRVDDGGKAGGAAGTAMTRRRMLSTNPPEQDGSARNPPLPIRQNGASRKRRRFFRHLIALLLTPVLPAVGKERTAVTPLTKPKSEWKFLLPDERYGVLFEGNTERPFSSALHHENRSGTYVCAACALPLFDSVHKFDSGTGWPSFRDARPGALGTRTDFRLIWPRTEYHCARCGGHQGHVFKDGPTPTGLRYCNNGLALQFVPASDSLPELRS